MKLTAIRCTLLIVHRFKGTVCSTVAHTLVCPCDDIPNFLSESSACRVWERRQGVSCFAKKGKGELSGGYPGHDRMIHVRSQVTPRVPPVQDRMGYPVQERMGYLRQEEDGILPHPKKDEVPPSRRGQGTSLKGRTGCWPSPPPRDRLCLDRIWRGRYASSGFPLYPNEVGVRGKLYPNSPIHCYHRTKGWLVAGRPSDDCKLPTIQSSSVQHIGNAPLYFSFPVILLTQGLVLHDNW